MIKLFEPMAMIKTIRIVLDVAAFYRWIVHKKGVDTFLKGWIHDKVFMEQPLGFMEPSKDNLVCKLQKALYGLKQTPIS